MTQDERIEKLEREVAELRGAIDMLTNRTFWLQTFGNIKPIWTDEGPVRKPPFPPMCEAKQQDLPQCHL